MKERLYLFFLFYHEYTQKTYTKNNNFMVVISVVDIRGEIHQFQNSAVFVVDCNFSNEKLY